MHYCRLGNSGLEVSRLCLGTMMFGGPTDEAESIRIIHAAMDCGVNFFDTANVYNDGASEVVVGKALATRRDQVILATKGRQPLGVGPNQGNAGRRHLLRAVDDSLRRMNTDYIDLYYVHAPDYATPIEETLRALDDLVRSGKVHYLGCSNVRAWRLCQALWTSDRCNLHRFTCVQPLYNLVNRDIEVELLPLCREYGMGVVTYSPLARGILTGKYRAGEAVPKDSRAGRRDQRIQQTEWRDESLAIAQQLAQYCETRQISPSQFALAWCLANPVVTSVIVGPRTQDQFEDHRQCLDVQLFADDEGFIDRLVPPGEHSGKGFQDPMYPVTGRQV